jgi:tripartite-type tricarboxylate transporter receptor subunit TctC
MRPRVQAGKVKVIALTNAEHASALNDIPTAREAGFSSLELDGLVGLLGPKDMPLALREKIAADIKQVLSDPEINAKLAATGQVVNPGTPKEFEAALNEQSGKVADIGRILGIKAAGN